MARKLLGIVTNNLPFKILAVGLAFILWLVVYNIDDPKITQTFTTNVTVENVSAVTEQNKCYEVLDNSNIVTFAVTAKRSVLKNLEDTDFRAVADLTRMMIEEGGTTASVPIEISSVRSNNALNYPNKKYLKLSLENLAEKRVMITADTSGTVAQGYALGEVTVVNPSRLRISGPESIVEKVASVVATIDVDGMSVNLSDTVMPVLYDANGKEIDTTRLTLSASSVTVSARILVIKELPLSFSTTGTPEGDYSVVGITSDPQVVEVKGASSVLNPIMSLVIPEDIIDVTGATESISTTIDITEFLPDGVELVDAADGRVSVTVRIEPYKTQRYMISTDRIQVVGLEEGYELSFPDASVYVTVSALQRDLNLLSMEEIAASIDVTGLTEGTHQVVLVLELNEENYAYQVTTVTVHIAEAGAEEPGENAGGDSGEAPGEEEGNAPDSAENENQNQ
ncbi:MAG: CdaR family protein [Muribaculaceae bacterium]|nr:CdaR family protein [Roseburia sp.]MCM1431824.1 CdaR family protein [Muribaculaceae bacterium]MCM1493505.1 CdaR family protein [Muribaculaceae bacterium]